MTCSTKQHSTRIVVCIVKVCHREGPPERGDSIWATENAGFNATVQRNLGLDFVTKNLAKTSTSLQLSASDMLTHVNFERAVLAGAF